MYTLTHINFKAMRQKFDADLLLWITFYDNNTRTVKNISFPNSLPQMYFKKMPVKASLKYVWEKYHELLETDFKGKWKVARIYASAAKGPEDFIVEYLANGKITYKNNEGVEISAPRWSFTGPRWEQYEKELEGKMEIFLMQIKNEHTIKA